MSEQHSQAYSTESRIHRLTRRAGLAAAGLALGIPASALAFTQVETDTTIAGQRVEISPTLDHNITLYNGVLVPDVQLPVDAPFDLGVSADVGNATTPTTANNSKEALERTTAVIGSLINRPQAEIDAVQAIVTKQLAYVAGAGLGAALVPAGLSLLIGGNRRRELAQMLGEYDKKYGLLRIGAAACSLVVIVYAPGSDVAASKQMQQAEFIPLSTAVPYAAEIPELDQVKVRNTDVTVAASDLLEGIITSYEGSKQFYENVVTDLVANKDQFRTPANDEKVVVIYSDRHDNVGSDIVLKEIIALSGATLSIGVGDETSSGMKSEEFSLRSIDEVTREMEERAAIVGNHDNSPTEFVENYFEKHKFATDNDKVQTFAESSLLLRDDYRSSGYTPERVTNGTTDEEEQDKTADIACDYGRVNILVVSKRSLGQDALERGCVDIAISADTHVQSGPTAVFGENENGSTLGYEVTNGTSGGAAFAVALGKYRRDASYTSITLNGGVPVAEQHVTINTKGISTISDATDLVPSSGSDSASGANDFTRKQKKSGKIS